MIKFLRVETRCDNVVAVFHRGYRQWEPTGAGGSHLDDGTFCLNEESLRDRITNLEAGSYDTSVERHALECLISCDAKEPQADE